jgi:hypothetical protein
MLVPDVDANILHPVTVLKKIFKEINFRKFKNQEWQNLRLLCEHVMSYYTVILHSHLKKCCVLYSNNKTLNVPKT